MERQFLIFKKKFISWSISKNISWKKKTFLIWIFKISSWYELFLFVCVGIALVQNDYAGDARAASGREEEAGRGCSGTLRAPLRPTARPDEGHQTGNNEKNYKLFPKLELPFLFSKYYLLIYKYVDWEDNSTKFFFRAEDRPIHFVIFFFKISPHWKSIS